jgi:hypothetical protein
LQQQQLQQQQLQQRGSRPTGQHPAGWTREPTPGSGSVHAHLGSSQMAGIFAPQPPPPKDPRTVRPLGQNAAPPSSPVHLMKAAGASPRHTPGSGSRRAHLGSGQMQSLMSQPETSVAPGSGTAPMGAVQLDGRGGAFGRFRR